MLGNKKFKKCKFDFVGFPWGQLIPVLKEVIEVAATKNPKTPILNGHFLPLRF